MENVEEKLYEVLYKKLNKLKREFNNLKETNGKLEIENKFLNKEIKKLKETNIKLLKFQDEKEKVANRIKKLLKKINGVKGL